MNCNLITPLSALFVSLFLLAPAAVAQARTEKGRQSTRFLRLERLEDGQPDALETAIVRYVPATGEGELIIDLVGVVHYGDRSYYRALNRLLRQYDAVLYELVAPAGHRVPTAGGGDSRDPLRMIMRAGQAMMGLESQLELIDYRRKNFVHADLSPAEMLRAMSARGENGVTLALGITADLLREYNKEQVRVPPRPTRNAQGRAAQKAIASREADLFTRLFEPGGVTDLKRTLAEELARQSAAGGGLGQTVGAILIGDRNEAAMRVFAKELAKGKKRIAIFYGAAHMPDFARRLVTDFDLKKSNSSWLTAWDLSDSDASPVEGLLRMLDEELTRDLLDAKPRAPRPAREPRQDPQQPPRKAPSKRRRIII